jgi:hypothetical protein
MSFFLHKDCEQVPVVNGEEKEASPPLYPYGRTPWGYVALVQVRGTPGSCLAEGRGLSLLAAGRP